MIAVTVPIALPSCANLREHWAKRAQRAKSHREVAFLVLRQPVERLGWRLAPRSHEPRKRRSQANVEPARAILVVTLTRIAPRALDDDNLRGACKAIRDGVADALGVDDRDGRVLWRYGQERGQPREQAVGITIMLAPDMAQPAPPCANVL